MKKKQIDKLEYEIKKKKSRLTRLERIVYLNQNKSKYVALNKPRVVFFLNYVPIMFLYKILRTILIMFF